MKHRIIQILVVSLIVAAMLAVNQAPVMARPGTGTVTGSGSLSSQPVSGTIWADGAGNFHFRKLTYTGNVFLEGDVTIQGTQTLELTGYADPTQSGPFTGRYTICDLEGTVLWTGVIEGYSLNAISVARVVAQGKGPYAGTQLKLSIFEDAPSGEIPDPQTFYIEGKILDRQTP